MEKSYRSLPHSFIGEEQFAYLAVESNLDKRKTNTNLTLQPVSKGGKILERGAIVPHRGESIPHLNKNSFPVCYTPILKHNIM